MSTENEVVYNSSDDNDNVVGDDEFSSNTGEHNSSVEQDDDEDDHSDFDEEDDIMENHIAIEIIDELHQQNVLDEDHFNKYKKLVRKEMNILSKVQHNESYNTKKSNSLLLEFNNEKKKLDEITSKAEQSSIYISELKRDLLKVENKLALCQENETISQTTQIELERKKNSLQDQIETMKNEQIEKEKPIIGMYLNEIDAINIELDHMNKRVNESEMNIKNFKEQEEKTIEEKEQLKREYEETLQNLNNMNIDPDKIRSRTSAAYKALDKQRKVYEQKEVVVSNLENEIDSIQQKQDEYRDAKEKMKSSEDKSKLESKKLKQVISKLKQGTETERDAGMMSERTRVMLNMELSAKQREYNVEFESLKAVQKEEETTVKNIFITENKIKNIQRDIEKIKDYKSDIEKDLEKLKADDEKLEKKNQELEREVDIQIHNFLVDEAKNNRSIIKIKTKREELDILEKTCLKMRDDEKILVKTTNELSLEKERMAREASKNKRLFLETTGEVKVKLFINKELQKKLKEIDAQNKILTKLYSEVKQERNKNARQLQEHAQLIAEVQEKNKILTNELEVLTRKSIYTEKEFVKVCRTVQEELNARENLRNEKSKLLMHRNEKEKLVEEQSNEIEKLNSIINSTEIEMLMLKQQYEHGVQERNFTGIQLIDRNDELCILYEKANIQENIIKNGEIELKKKEQEERFLNLELDDLERELKVVQKLLPEMDSSELERKHLLEEIKIEKQKSDEYSKKLEDPQNESRWRYLKGDVPSEDELKEKIQDLEEKLNSRKEQLMEKNLVLQEVTKSSDKLRKMAINGRDHTFDLAIGMNELQAKIREINRKMMSTLSELSVYQATSMSLEDRNNKSKKYVEQIKNNVEKGEIPSREIEQEFYSSVMLEEKRKGEYRNRKERLEAEKDIPPTVTRTTAAQRPNSYIPDDELGIPVPYMMKPMMYSEIGSTMRHTRNPKPKKIVI